jgi:hypothetical protein
MVLSDALDGRSAGIRVFPPYKANMKELPQVAEINRALRDIAQKARELREELSRPHPMQTTRISSNDSPPRRSTTPAKKRTP